MKHLFKPNVVKRIWSLLVLLLIVKMLWFFVEVLWLPTIGVEQSEDKGAKALYYRVKLSPNGAPAPTTTISYFLDIKYYLEEKCNLILLRF